MTYPLSEIDGLPADAALRLKKAGIRTTSRLLDAAASMRGRKTLAARTGLSECDLLEWANKADYLRIKGMGKGRAGLIRAVGVPTVKALKYRNPERLAEAMAEANRKSSYVRNLPSVASIKRLIESAGKLPNKITY